MWVGDTTPRRVRCVTQTHHQRRLTTQFRTVWCPTRCSRSCCSIHHRGAATAVVHHDCSLKLRHIGPNPGGRHSKSAKPPKAHTSPTATTTGAARPHTEGEWSSCTAYSAHIGTNTQGAHRYHGSYLSKFSQRSNSMRRVTRAALIQNKTRQRTAPTSSCHLTRRNKHCAHHSNT
jgi:hypothetical protein